MINQIHHKKCTLLGLVLILFTATAKAGPTLGPTPSSMMLTPKSVQSIIQALPEISRKTASHHQKLMGGMGGAGGATPQLSEKELLELNDIMNRHGLSMEQFAMQMSILMATYFTLRPQALSEYLPSEKSPEVQAILKDPKVAQKKKDALRQQIKFAKNNMGQIQAQFSMLATPENQKVLKPYLNQLKKVFDDARAAQKSNQKKKK